MRKDCSSDPEKVLKFKTDSQEFATILRSIYSNSERQLQFLKHNAFVTFSVAEEEESSDYSDHRFYNFLAKFEFALFHLQDPQKIQVQFEL